MHGLIQHKKLPFVPTNTIFIYFIFYELYNIRTLTNYNYKVMIHKQKPDWNITGLLPAIASYLIFILTFIIWDPTTAFYTLGCIILLYAVFIFYAYVRTKHAWTMISAIYMVIFGSLLFSMAPHLIIGRHVEFPAFVKVMIVFTVVLFWWLVYLNFTRKLKWRGREILELAAYQVEQTEGSFTERPQPTGKVHVTKDELNEFARYFQKKLLGLVYWEDSRVVFMPLKYKNEYFALYNPNYNYQDKTWIAINYNGNVSVNISKKDYLEYREDLAFDELCKSLSDVMIEFLELFIEGKEVRIIDKMNALRVNVFT